jgi:hypothetical protein
MKSRSTAFWFVLAAMLSAAIWFWQRHGASGPAAVNRLLPDFHAEAITGVQVIPTGEPAIEAELTNGVWQLEKPYPYPAQAPAIQYLISRLEKLVPATRLSATEIGGDKNADTEYGFLNPQYAIVLSAGNRQWQLRVGKRTAPGDQVFVRLAGADGAFVTDTGWLQLLPHDATAWRDTSLVAAVGDFSTIEITNGMKAIELRRDPTNHLWRMTRPLNARADNDRITTALEQLHSTQISGFVTDDPKADLTGYGLQPAGLSLWLGDGTNLTAGVQLGKPVPDSPGLVYARRAGWDSIVSVPNDSFSPWRGAVNDFRDPHLLEITVPVTQINVGGSTPFTLQTTGSNIWKVVGESFPVDLDSVREFLGILAGLRVAEFVKDNNTATDLQGFGLDDATATNQITLLAAAGGTNRTIAQIRFGQATTNGVYVRRADENSVYALSRGDFNQLRLLESPWVFRDRRIWNFSETNVVQITLRQNGKTRVLQRQGVNLWDLAESSQGLINPPTLEETAHRLGQLTALDWMGRNVTGTEGGFNPGNLQITVELKNGEKFSVAFGAELPQANTALAAVTLANERWVFVFPPVVYQFVSTYLTIPADVP